MQGIRLSFFGAAGEVTGSCYLIETDRARVLVDFGMHQGSREADERNHRFPPIDAPRLDAVVLTHAHIDHVGRMPLLVQLRYPGLIFATPASCDLAALLLRDSAAIQEADAARDARRAYQRGEPEPKPLYSRDDAEQIIPRFEALPYDQPKEIAPGITIRFVDAGHIIGSASVEMRVESNGSAPKTIFFSGDLGPLHTPLLRDYTAPFAPRRENAAGPPIEPDVVIMESTYGDRDHQSLSSSVDEFASVVHQACDAEGKILVPAFAVGRTQQLVYHYGVLLRARRVPMMPVYVDSPMALAATNLYNRNLALFDEDTAAIIASGNLPLMFPGLEFIHTSEESRRLNDDPHRAMIIAASGMCTGGRILHHLKHHLWRPQTHVIIAGYQAAGSLGRQLVDHARRVMIMGDPIAVRAKIHTIGGFSAHAGRTDLISWASGIKGKPVRLFLTHGESKPRLALRAALKESIGIEAACPEFHQVVEL